MNNPFALSAEEIGKVVPKLLTDGHLVIAGKEISLQILKRLLSDDVSSVITWVIYE